MFEFKELRDMYLSEIEDDDFIFDDLKEYYKKNVFEIFENEWYVLFEMEENFDFFDNFFDIYLENVVYEIG